MKKTILSLAIAASLSFTAGCGGGGGSSSDDVEEIPTPVVPVASSLEGTAAAGIILQGIVTAFELRSDGTAIESNIGTARTDDRGHYNLTLNDNYNGGIVRVSITGDTNTKMKCDAFGENSCGIGLGFGSLVDLPEGLSLDAIISPSGSSVNVQITPLTHMAAARATSSGSVTTESVLNAISEVSSFAGVNIMNTEVPDITEASSLNGVASDAKHLALLNASLASLLFAGDVEANFNDKLDELASSFVDGDFDDDDAIKISDIVAAMQSAVTAAGESDALQDAMEDTVNVITQQVAVINSQIEDGTYNPEPTDSASQTKIDQAKSLLTTARTFIEQIGSEFETPVEALNIDAETTAAILSDDTAIMGALLGEALSQVINDLDGKTDLSQELDNPSSYATSLVNGMSGEAVSGAIVTTFSTDGGIAVTLNGTLAGSVDGGESRSISIVNLRLQTNVEPSDLTVSAGVVDRFTANDVRLLLTGQIGNLDTSLTLTNVSMEVSTTGIDVDLTDDADDGQVEVLERAITAASFDGEMLIRANGASFDGDVAIRLVDLDERLVTVNPLSVANVAVDGEFSSGRGSFSAGAELRIDNANSFNTFGLLTHSNMFNSEFTFEFSPSLADQLIVMSTYESIAAVFGATVSDIVHGYIDVRTRWSCTNDGCTSELEFEAFALFSTGIYGFQSVAGLSDDFESSVVDEVARVTGVTPTEVYIYNAELYMDGSVDVDLGAELPNFESADNFVEGTIVLSATANVPELPEASVVVSASRTEFSGGDASVIVSHDGQSFTLDISSLDVEVEQPEAILTLSNSDDVRMELNLIKDDDVHVVDGYVAVGDTQVGTVSETESGIVLVRYNDGSFESLY